jgi:hypothetical protein
LVLATARDNPFFLLPIYNKMLKKMISLTRSTRKTNTTRQNSAIRTKHQRFNSFIIHFEGYASTFVLKCLEIGYKHAKKSKKYTVRKAVLGERCLFDDYYYFGKDGLKYDTKKEKELADKLHDLRTIAINLERLLPTLEMQKRTIQSRDRIIADLEETIEILSTNTVKISPSFVKDAVVVEYPLLQA